MSLVKPFIASKMLECFSNGVLAREKLLDKIGVFNVCCTSC